MIQKWRIFLFRVSQQIKNKKVQCYNLRLMSHLSQSTPHRTISQSSISQKSKQKTRHHSAEKKQVQKIAYDVIYGNFIKQYSSKSNIQFKASEIISKFKLHKKKVYQFLQILQGCGCVIKPKYGFYKWVGVTNYQPIEPENTQKVKSLSYNMKKIIDEAQQTWQFKMDQMLRKLFLICTIKNIRLIEEQFTKKVELCLTIFVLLNVLRKNDGIYTLSSVIKEQQAKKEKDDFKLGKYSKNASLQAQQLDPDWSTKSINERSKKMKNPKQINSSKRLLNKEKKQLKKVMKQETLQKLNELDKFQQQKSQQMQKFQEIRKTLIKLFWDQSQIFEKNLKQFLGNEQTKGNQLRARAERQGCIFKQGFKKIL